MQVIMNQPDEHGLHERAAFGICVLSGIDR